MTMCFFLVIISKLDKEDITKQLGKIREPPLLQQVGFKMFEVITISNFTGQGETDNIFPRTAILDFVTSFGCCYC